MCSEAGLKGLASKVNLPFRKALGMSVWDPCSTCQVYQPVRPRSRHKGWCPQALALGLTTARAWPCLGRAGKQWVRCSANRLADAVLIVLCDHAQ